MAFFSFTKFGRFERQQNVKYANERQFEYVSNVGLLVSVQRVTQTQVACRPAILRRTMMFRSNKLIKWDRIISLIEPAAFTQINAAADLMKVKMARD